MTFLITLVTILQSFAISLGVGSSTLAITNFFVAIADGKIDDTERRMMGVVYVVLRVAMVAILITTVILLAYQYSYGLFVATGLTIGQIIALLVLYTNALLMTYHLVPSTFGPAIQAGSWYTLGTLLALQVLGYTGFSLTVFLLAYVTWIILAIGIVNGIMAILKSIRKDQETA
tara:strand:- start:10682 stop:11203 length:522 start_codon:yes stop_codon:yes gene_type:complete